MAIIHIVRRRSASGPGGHAVRAFDRGGSQFHGSRVREALDRLVGDSGEHVRRYASGSRPFSFAVSIRL